MTEQERVRARKKRMDNPREPIHLKIKAGQLVHKCKACGKRIPASLTTCPCGGKDFEATHPDKTNYYTFPNDTTGEAKKRFGEYPVILPFTFMKPPRESVRIGRECWQGGKMFCNSYMAVDNAGNFSNTAQAHRSGLQKPIKCEPENCPYSIGGDVQGKHINPKQCGECIYLYVWLPDLEGFDNCVLKSGSIETINNVMSAIQKLTIFMSNMKAGYIPIRLELRLVPAGSTYQNEKGERKIAKFFTTIIHFPFSVKAIQDSLEKEQFNINKLVYSLPQALSGGRELPGPEYDPLIDGPREHQATSEVSESTERLMDKVKGKSQETPIETPQAELCIIEEESAEIKSRLNKLCKNLSDGDGKNLKKLFRKTFEVPSIKVGETGIRFNYDAIPMKKLSMILDWLTDKEEAQKRANISKEEADESFNKGEEYL